MRDGYRQNAYLQIPETIEIILGVGVAMATLRAPRLSLHVSVVAN